jgi:uncharacterized membrane protein YoaK (UPF0700 family)
MSLMNTASPSLRRDETVQIALLVTIGAPHNRLRDLAGTLGISFVAAMQTVAFTKGVLMALSGGGPRGPLRRSGIFAALCFAFGVGAAVGAFATKVIPDLMLGIPVAALLIILLRCEIERSEVPA